MIQLRVDFNARGRGGLVKASLARTDAPLRPGDWVLAIDPDEDMQFDAQVREVDEQTGKVYLDILWEPAACVASVMSGPYQAALSSATVSLIATDRTSAAFDPGHAALVKPAKPAALHVAPR